MKQAENVDNAGRETEYDPGYETEYGVKRVKLLGAFVDRLDMQGTLARTATLIELGEPFQIVTLNPEYLYRAQYMPALFEPVREAGLVTADGEGIVWACKMAGHPVPERVTGIDLMLELCKVAADKGWSIFLLGAEPGVARGAAEGLKRRLPNLEIAGTRHGYFAADEEIGVVNSIRQAHADILFVALGAPRQELWIHKHLAELGVKAAVGVGGSFDVIAGKVRRAPGWSQKLKLEWLARLFMDPKRWRRMLVLPKFAWLVLRKYGF